MHVFLQHPSTALWNIRSTHCVPRSKAVTTRYHNVLQHMLQHGPTRSSCLTRRPGAHVPGRARACPGLVVEHIETTCPEHRCKAFGLCHAPVHRKTRNTRQTHGKHTANMESYRKTIEKKWLTTCQKSYANMRNMFKHDTIFFQDLKKTKEDENMIKPYETFPWPKAWTQRCKVDCAKDKASQGWTPNLISWIYPNLIWSTMIYNDWGHLEYFTFSMSFE